MADAVKHLRPFFGSIPASRIDFDLVSRYISRRLRQPRSARGTVQKELAALGRMLTLAVQANRLPSRPVLPTLKLNNVRRGFFTDDQVLRVLAELPEWYAPAIEFAWRTGWRIGEIKSLAWTQVDWEAGTVRLEVGATKNREGRMLPFAASEGLTQLLRLQRERTDAYECAHDTTIDWVFWRDGKKLGDHRDTWKSACKRAGVPGKLVHDLRRTAVRNLERAAVPRSVAMKITGHKTESVYRRYAIVGDSDLVEALRKLEGLYSAKMAKIGPPLDPAGFKKRGDGTLATTTNTTHINALQPSPPPSRSTTPTGS